jgi:hypothetical protein
MPYGCPRKKDEAYRCFRVSCRCGGYIVACLCRHSCLAPPGSPRALARDRLLVHVFLPTALSSKVVYGVGQGDLTSDSVLIHVTDMLVLQTY